MNSAWKHVIKPQAEQHAGLNERNLGMLAEEKRVWEKIKGKHHVLKACVRAVKQESETLSVFAQKRNEVASAMRTLCENDMRDVFLRPLLTHMGILDDYECIGNDGQWKIDV
eukprot:5804553-Pyramimonas_sp.AAC.1